MESETNKKRKKYPNDLWCEKLYKAWFAMHDRCENKDNKQFDRYGGRGIKVCDEWSDYAEFAKWSLKNGFSDDLSIDRINNDGNYEPSNCRWTTMKMQQNNRSSNKRITINGETKTISEWCDEYDINYNTVLQRMKYGMDVLTALTRTHKYRGYGIPVRCVDTGEIFSSSKKAAEKYGVSLGMIARAARTGCNACGMKWEQVYSEIQEKKRYRKTGAEIEKGFLVNGNS